MWPGQGSRVSGARASGMWDVGQSPREGGDAPCRGGEGGLWRVQPRVRSAQATCWEPHPSRGQRVPRPHSCRPHRAVTKSVHPCPRGSRGCRGRMRPLSPCPGQVLSARALWDSLMATSWWLMLLDGRSGREVCPLYLPQVTLVQSPRGTQDTGDQALESRPERAQHLETQDGKTKQAQLPLQLQLLSPSPAAGRPRLRVLA